MDPIYFLTARELYEAKAEYDRWLDETGNAPEAVADEMLSDRDVVEGVA